MTGNYLKRLSFLLLALVVLSAPAGAVEHGSFPSDGATIHYLEQGEGEPVVLIHGFTANAMLNWVGPGIFDALAEEYRVIALDARGHGRSDKPHDPDAYGPKMAEDVIHLLDHLGIDRAHIVGYSMGGFITTYLVARHPERILSAVPGGAGWSEPGDPRTDMADEIAEALENGEGLTPLFLALSPTGRPAPTEQSIEMMNRAILAMNDADALAAVMRGMKHLAVAEEELAATSVPVRAVIGEIDPLRLTVDQMKRALPSLDVVVVKGGDHMSTLNDPAYLEAIREHLVRNSAFALTAAPAGDASLSPSND